MLCETCQVQNDHDANFCANCGSMLVQICASCAYRNALKTRICIRCGSPLPTAGRIGGALNRGGLLASRAAREGERKRLTVLIADVVGSTAFIDRLNAEEAANRLGIITSAMREAVARFEGTVNKLQGDGVMALFGAPISQEDHAVRACCAALAMIENVRSIENAPPIRIGIDTGEVVVKTLLTDVSEQYDAMGRTVHIAARLEHEAADFGVAMTAATFQATGGAVDAEAIGERHLRGISEPIPVFALKGIRPAIASQQFRGGQKLSPFVGRDKEILALSAALDEARAARSPVIGIVGEAGSGKSRLVFEFLESCRAGGFPVLEARATGYGRATPLRPILDLYHTFFGISDESSKETAAARVEATLARYNLTQDLPLVLDFLGLPLADRTTLPSDVALRRLRLLESAGRLARAVALSQPSIFVVEDLHWLDTASEAFLETLADSITGTKTLMLVNFRQDYSSPWMKRPYYREIAVAPLGPGAIERMLDHALGKDASLANLRRRIVERAGGNPFFAEELIRASVEQKVLSGSPGDYRAIAGQGEASLPSTVEAVLGSRIDRLTEVDKLFLQAAAVVGKEFSLSVVAKVAQVAIQIARASLQLLVGAEMLYERPDVQRDDFSFRHPLVQEAAYGSLLTEQRSHLHRGTAAALAVKFRDRLDEYSSLIGYHWEKGGEHLFAAASYLKFALWIGARDPRHALDSWRNVRRLVQQVPPTPEVEYMLMMACGQIVNFAWWGGTDASEIEPVFEQAVTLANKFNDARAAALIIMAFGRVLLIAGSSDDYVAKVEEAQKLIKGPGNESVEAMLRAVYSHALLSAGLLSRALEANTRALGGIHQLEKRDRQTLGFEPEPWLQTQRARILMYLGQIPEADAILDALLCGPPTDLVHVVNAHGTRIECYRKTRPELAIQQAELLQDALRENATPYLRVLGNRYLALAMLANDTPQEAADLLRETIDYARAQKAGLEVEAYLYTTLAEALIATGSAVARSTAIEARDLARRRAMRIAEAQAERLLMTLGEDIAESDRSPGQTG
jgi:class 3 adenylate cyclase/tetratricopeptide (TPR) repeat protein